MQKARRHSALGGAPTACKHVVSGSFHSSLVGALFIIQSPYWFTIGRQVVFSLGGWAPQLHTEFHELRATLDHLGYLRQTLQDWHLLWFGFRSDSRPAPVCHIGVHNPGPKTGLGLSAFARRYLRNRGFFIFLQVLRCFSSLSLASTTYAFSRR